MQTNPIFDDRGRDGQVARTLNAALHALILHDGRRATIGGEEITVGYRRSIREEVRAFAAMGVQPDETFLFLRPGS
ncbi:hypothetical protein B0G84_7691 [Paraburkholderia sp. BL8N3]|nr:hypothetical protein [Paraburkholderia sp. BL8N3]TCK33465.1 hypothetical protein B0G84_7691 [Paraburkholderia sp. BL8N3]